LHSGFPLQNNSFSIHSPLPHESFPSGQIGSSVLRIGKTFLGSKMMREKKKNVKKRFVGKKIVLSSYGYQQFDVFVYVLDVEWR
jgi:hypothetical protein